jgi:2-polyprenyl-6-methoxyphenol hydroxylase-like FAD-dependent oxidoreductase
MADQIETQVLIMGGGPVGLTLGMDLAQRGGPHRRCRDAP